MTGNLCTPLVCVKCGRCYISAVRPPQEKSKTWVCEKCR